jgi:gluconolactonase
MRIFALTALASGVLFACTTPAPTPATETIGSIDRATPEMDAIVAPDAQIEVLARGYVWPEGPVWVDDEQALYFNDVPENKMYRWTAETGANLFLTPSGGATPEMAQVMREPGANGIIEWSGAPGKLLLADHGARGLSVLDPSTKSRETIVSTHDGKSLNSPNDIVERSDGTLFFTDPPYGLKNLNEAAEKELSYNGVYRLEAGEPAALIIDDLSFPNGIGLSPDEATLYVAVSDPEGPMIMAYDTTPEGGVSNPRAFFDAAEDLKDGGGLPDGMDISRNGTIFATGPKGVYVLSPDGEVLGTISTGMATSNCTLNDDETYLYMTSSSVLARVPLDLK